MKKLLLLAIVVLGISAVSFGQNGNSLTATAPASAKILSVLNISKTGGSLHFGVMTKPQENLTVTLTPTADRSVTTGNATMISLLDVAPLKEVPTYEVTGELSASFSILLPSSLVLGPGMTVNNFVTSLGANTEANKITNISLDGISGKKTFTVGADLVLVASNVVTKKDPYTVNFNVTVAYE